jgi:secreted trypsin-like serine protease
VFQVSQLPKSNFSSSYQSFDRSYRYIIIRLSTRKTPFSTLVTSAYFSDGHVFTFHKNMSRVCITLSLVLLFAFTQAGVKIAGGGLSVLGDLPHVVAIGGREQEDSFCTGALIAPNYVLTAAHCYIGANNTNLANNTGVYVGRVNILDESVGQFINVLNVYPHPDYIDTAKGFDMLLLQLESNVTANATVKPALLLRQDILYPGQWLYAAGWGLRPGPNQTYPNISIALEYQPKEQYKTKIPVVDATTDDYCSQTTMNLTRTFCAGLGDGNDTCKGDSGGPLSYYSNTDQNWIITGVVSYGGPYLGCGFEGNKGVYEKVSYYIPWIESYTGPLQKPITVNVTTAAPTPTPTPGSTTTAGPTTTPSPTTPTTTAVVFQGASVLSIASISIVLAALFHVLL